MKLLLFIIMTIITLHSQTTQNGDHELFYAQTAMTMNEGQSSLTSFQLLNLNYNYGFSNDIQLGVYYFGRFSSSTPLNMHLFAKYKFYESESYKFAIFSNYETNVKSFSSLIITSYVFDENSVNLSFGFKQYDGDGSNHVINFGSELSVSKKYSLVLEYSNEMPFGEDLDDYSTIALGLRSTGENFLWELGIFTKLDFDNDEAEHLILPVLKCSYYFD